MKIEVWRWGRGGYRQNISARKVSIYFAGRKQQFNKEGEDEFGLAVSTAKY
jgi:hypothetical protein